MSTFDPFLLWATSESIAIAGEEILVSSSPWGSSDHCKNAQILTEFNSFLQLAWGHWALQLGEYHWSGQSMSMAAGPLQESESWLERDRTESTSRKSSLMWFLDLINFKLFSSISLIHSLSAAIVNANDQEKRGSPSKRATELLCNTQSIFFLHNQWRN